MHEFDCTSIYTASLETCNQRIIKGNEAHRHLRVVNCDYACPLRCTVLLYEFSELCPV